MTTKANYKPFFSQMKRSKSRDLTTWLSKVDHQCNNKEQNGEQTNRRKQTTKNTEKKKDATVDNQALTRISRLGYSS